MLGGPLPPMFIEIHAGGRCYASSAGKPDRLVFDGMNETRTFSPGPTMRYATLSAKRLRVLHDGTLLGSWKLPQAKLLAWWNLPIVSVGSHVYQLLLGGRKKQLAIPAPNLVTALPTKSGSFYALYTTRSHWRILHRTKRGDHWTNWLPGHAADFTPTQSHLYVATGETGISYKAYGADGPGALWSYAYGTHKAEQVQEIPRHTKLVFDSPWVRETHLASLLIWNPEQAGQVHWYPAKTNLLRLEQGLAKPIAEMQSGWEVYAFDAATRRFLGLHINRKNMGFILCQVNLDGAKETLVSEYTDAIDISSEAPYLPFINE